ncbi:hypothetical protein CMUS01_01510 [Colletotrichum musicola]|uniref:Methyltransferase type 11 domain-containing protein n=1 Tax=Colletotrichum musicola TaxID=2175873 RepID=A0A8H6U8G2_9PEZI|nr:hypothetical protein CMUS01_01510 [Colletotrichum musicola]
MATLRMGSGLPSRPDEPIRARRAAASTEPREDPRLPQRVRREGENIRIAIQQPTQIKPNNRGPQNAHARRPSIPAPPNRPPLTHQTQSWSSNSTASERPNHAHAPSLSASSTSGRSQAGTPKPRNVLRRKQSSVAQKTPSLRHDSQTDSTRTSSSSSAPRSRSSLDPAAGMQLDRGFTESPTEIRIAHVVDLPKTQAQTVTIYPELDRYRDFTGRPSTSSEGSSVDFLHRLATHDLPPPTPVFSGTSSQLSAFSGSPSTRFSESPGPGPYSRDTTPTSMSSQSPGLMAHIPAPRTRQLSPALTRPPVTRRRAGSTNEMDAFSADPQGLAAVRESLTSSSSNSTVREVERKGSKKKKRLSPLPPSPPPRKSSQKFTKVRDNEDSPSKTKKEPAQPVMAPPSPIQSPPRLVPSASPRQTPPIRPSRENTPDLQSQLFGPLPVIHSNLSSTSLSYDRPQVGSRSVTPSAYPEKPHTSRLPVGRESTPAPRPVNPSDGKKKTDGRATRTPSPNTSAFSRFPFFGRRSKTAPEVPQVDKKDKSTRKGPAAGTGHEGYGRLGAIRRRSGSSTTNLNRGNLGPGSSQDSLSNSQPIDTFLLERMNPVVISGGGIVENRNNSIDLPRTESNQSLGYVSDVSTTSSAGRLGLAPSAIPRGTHASLAHRRPSDSSDSEAVTMKSTLAFRRSVQRLRSSPDQSPLKLPKPINTTGITAPSMDSHDTTILSDDSQFEKHREVIRGRIAAATATPPKKLTKRTRSPRKWNLFSRSQSQPNKNKQSEAVPVAATVTVVQHKPAAFYTMMDGSEQEDYGPPDVEEILREAVVFDLPSPPPIKERRASTTSQEQRRESLSRLTLPTRSSQARRNSASAKSTSIPAIRSMKPTHNSQASTSKPAETRPSRLPQVGRIPKVVTSRPEHTSSRSFSRPFNRISMQMQPQAAGFNPDFVASGPSPLGLSTPELSRGESTTTGETNSDPRSSLVPLKTPEMIQIGREFLAFSPRKNSECTTSTSTSSSGGMYTLADALAYVPDPDAPLVEDEIWDEYNDLIGEVPPSATSSKGIPFHLEGHNGRLSKRSLVPLESPTIAPSKIPEKSGPSATSSSVYSADMTERLKAAFALKPENNSMTLVPVAEVPASVIDRESTELARKATVASQRSSNSSRKSRQSDCSCKSSEDESPISQVNLRVGSMTVSKWLSFGHVLFSPARDQLVPVVGSLKRHSILVVDGLGNDDWSFYAAETYPAATFFNLSPRAPLPEEHKNSSSFPLSPPNHHQIQYLSHTAKFPFGPESFTSVVFRFPAAAPESHYRNIVSEARRVLKPGGYLELSILDVDLNNMGNRGRRTIRRLKERIHERNAEISIGSSSDLILRLLGRKGFTDVKTCRVGVPVASIVSRSENGSKPPVSGARKPKEVRSLAEMMNDDGDSADENITKMVAKVGRWWYSRCYESAAGTAASRSIWADRALLTECEELRTSFKLMVCYARVPERARTASI